MAGYSHFVFSHIDYKRKEIETQSCNPRALNLVQLDKQFRRYWHGENSVFRISTHVTRTGDDNNYLFGEDEIPQTNFWTLSHVYHCLISKILKTKIVAESPKTEKSDQIKYALGTLDWFEYVHHRPRK